MQLTTVAPSLVLGLIFVLVVSKVSADDQNGEKEIKKWCHDFQHNDILHNDIRHNGVVKFSMKFMTFSIMTL